MQDELEAEMAQYTHEIRKGFALVIVNEKFKFHRYRNGAHAERGNITKFCNKAMFTVNYIHGLKLKDTRALKFDHHGDLITDDLTAQEMRYLFKIISTGDFSSYDAFICFISSHGGGGGILGVDGETVPVQYLVDQFKASDECRTLVGKPKLFFTQNCRGPLIGHWVPEPNDDNDNDDGVESDGGSKVPITIPTEADFLVAYSSVNGYEAYKNKKNGSLFIITLTQVLNKHAHNMSLTDMFALVNKEVGKVIPKYGKKQTPFFTSTLRKAIHFHLVESNEKQPSPQESEEPPAAPEELPAV